MNGRLRLRHPWRELSCMNARRGRNFATLPASTRPLSREILAFWRVLYCGATGRRYPISCRRIHAATSMDKLTTQQRSWKGIGNERDGTGRVHSTQMREGWPAAAAAAIKSCERSRRWSVSAVCSCDDPVSSRSLYSRPTLYKSTDSRWIAAIMIQLRTAQPAVCRYNQRMPYLIELHRIKHKWKFKKHTGDRRKHAPTVQAVSDVFRRFIDCCRTCA